MTMNNFRKMMQDFGLMYEERWTSKPLNIYYDVFTEIPDKDVHKVTKECLKRYKNFPSPADIWDAYNTLQQEFC